MLTSTLKSTQTTQLQTLSRAALARESPLTHVGPVQFARGKRTKRVATVSTGLQRVITQLSVVSARKKMPRMIKLSKEDLVRHDTIQRAWAQFQKDKRTVREEQLQKQHSSILNALDELQAVAPELYKVANIKEKGKRYPLDARVPVDFPPNTVWHYEVAQKATKNKK
ncbi:hypothetical protein BON22_2935 [Cyberlindnera fabianii]|uniref:Large ribosomal subunit protein mL40 n=1 Tax=Cyberlindnera fabianii TaxID=36022 RepID=A0A1V2L5P9_CYBFA|nr:hypothetical protein BON22_2935 [Cyberlindnera fabianii]